MPSFLRSKRLSTDYLDLSNVRTLILQRRTADAALDYYWPTSFPENAKGFLYFNCPNGGHLSLGELRFRTTTSSAPKTFPDGVDLTLPNGHLWSIPFSTILSDPNLLGICQKLESEFGGSLGKAEAEQKVLHHPVPLLMTIPGKRKRLSTDYLDLANIETLFLKQGRATARIDYAWSTPFPENAKGFLYFHCPAGAPPFHGELRFRTTASSLARTFSSGVDLTFPNGRLWSVPFSEIVNGPDSRAIRDKLDSEFDDRLDTANIVFHEVPSLVVGAAGRSKYFDLADTETLFLKRGRATARIDYAWPTPFPENAKGFLYFHCPAGAPPSHGELRFRTTSRVFWTTKRRVGTTSSAFTESFSSGHDLTLPSGRIWSISFSNIMNDPNLKAIREQLDVDLDGNLEETPEKHIAQYPFVPPLTISRERFSEHYLDLSNTKTLVLERHGSATSLEYDCLTPFPPNARGFLYFYRPSRSPLSKGELRFRTTKSSVPKSFSSGVDLTLPNDRGPWSISFSRIVSEPNLRAIRDKLSSELNLELEELNSVPQGNQPLPNLDPETLKKSDFLDLSFRSSMTFSATSWKLRYAPYDNALLRYLPFPYGTKGFLYYHVPENLPASLAPLAGEIRFRLTHLDEPFTFRDGMDLTRPDGMCWAVPLWHIIRKVHMKPALVELVKTGYRSKSLVSKETVERCAKLFKGIGRLHKITIFALGQPFPVKLNATSVTFSVMNRSGDALFPVTLDTRFLDGIPRDEDLPSHKSDMGSAHVLLLYDQVTTEFLAQVFKVQKYSGGPLVPVNMAPACITVKDIIRGNYLHLYHLLDNLPPFVLL
ncbi:hypothetical protein C8J56DRAFT_476299 [Mycena floridula]|nr:hypothetical protein C8J56DRAFT_476299 [Mycena floridula]